MAQHTQSPAATARDSGRSLARDVAREARDTVIELAGARKTYRSGSLEFEALKGIDLAIAEGEYVAIMGPSGSGKSTIMNVLGCLDTLTTGSYRLGGADVSELDEIDLAQIRNRRIGFVFQQFNLLPSLPAWRNVELPLLYGRVARDERRERAIDALERVGLASRLENRPGELSGGQQQRVAIARALVGEPTMILADEPTGNLDSVSTNDVLDLFDELHELGRTIVLITHELEVARRARRIVWVRDGEILRDEPVVDTAVAGRGAVDS
ncbi:ABC transporter ATP-binding protein [Marisediminicola sp. LYQ85]|uniref:ABC transporter ATP-binding protein n=1 Tax=Marisediminicola sp. LYQ85 TaxID=3391062 RepID=UPI003982FFEA